MVRLPENIKGEVFGGITAGVIALPMAIGFGVASGLGAAAGLYGAIIVGFIAAILGGTKAQISGPTGPTTVFVATIAAANTGNISVAFVIVALCGVFQIILGLCRVGRYIHYVPPAVVSGFMSGVGCLIIITQLYPFLGMTGQSSMLQAAKSLLTMDMVTVQCMILGVATLLLLTLRKIGAIIPISFFALSVVTAASMILKLDIPTSGAIPSGMPAIAIAPIGVESLFYVISIAFALALLASTDALMTSLIADYMTNTKHNSDRELIGQGLGNMISGLFGGTACSSSTVPTVANITTGARGRLSGVVHAILLFMALLFLGPIVESIPLAVLAGILIKTGIDILNHGFIKDFRQTSKADMIVKVAVMLITVFGNLLVAVGVGMVLYYAIRRLAAKA